MWRNTMNSLLAKSFSLLLVLCLTLGTLHNCQAEWKSNVPESDNSYQTVLAIGGVAAAAAIVYLIVKGSKKKPKTAEITIPIPSFETRNGLTVDLPRLSLPKQDPSPTHQRSLAVQGADSPETSLETTQLNSCPGIDLDSLPAGMAPHLVAY
jgi:hypothetical protein